MSGSLFAHTLSQSIKSDLNETVATQVCLISISIKLNSFILIENNWIDIFLFLNEKENGKRKLTCK